MLDVRIAQKARHGGDDVLAVGHPPAVLHQAVKGRRKDLATVVAAQAGVRAAEMRRCGASQQGSALTLYFTQISCIL